MLEEIDPKTGQKISVFNPVWLNWFIDLAAIITQAGGNSVGNVTGPAVSSPGDIAVFSNVNGTVLKDVSLAAAAIVTGPATATGGDVAVYDGTTGKLLKDTSLVAADLVSGPASAVDGNVALFDGVTGKLIKDGGTLGTAAFIAKGITATITTAKLTSGGTNGSMVFTDGILTSQVAAT